MVPSEKFPELLPLVALRAGEKCEVHSVLGTPELVRHLAEMGMQQGARLEVIRPGATCILRLNNAKLCLRGDELLQVMVLPMAAVRHSA